MRAVRVTDWGEPPLVAEIADPRPAAGRTIVRIEAATVAHVDRTIWSGAFLRPPALPYTPGVEGAGTVVDSDTFAVGTRVWIRGGGLGTVDDGTWAELVSAPDKALGALPEEVSFGHGAAFFSPCTSAWIALHDIAGVQRGERVLVTGATGAVGSIACQLALDAGADVVATVSRRERLDLLPAGVAGVVVGIGHGDEIGEAVDLLIDTVGGDVLTAVLSTVRPGGRAILVGYVAGTEFRLDLAAFMQRDVSLHPLNMIRRECAGRAIAPDLLARLADGRLRLDVTPFALDDAGAALRWLVESGHTGRAVLTPGSSTTAPGGDA